VAFAYGCSTAVGTGYQEFHALHDMMTDPNINPIARVQAIGLILDRGLGKPEESIRIQNDQESFDAAQERLDELFALAREQDSARHDE